MILNLCCYSCFFLGLFYTAAVRRFRLLNKMNTITIKEIEKKEFDDAKNLLKNGLNELAFNLFDLSTVKSKNIQVILESLLF